LRGLLREFGMVIPVGARHVVPGVWALIQDADCEIPDPLRPGLAELCREITELERRITIVEHQIAALAAQTPVVTRLMTIPGVGLFIATALIASVGDVQRFPSARHFANYLGLTPSERSSGTRRRLGAISKRGDAAKRAKQTDRLRTWALKIEKARGHNKAAAALANKIARIVWAVWKRDRPFLSLPHAA
jgi:transposase